MALERWRPLGGLTRRGPFEALERQMEDMIDRKNEILLRADLPGLDRKDIHVSVENGVLTLQGSRQQEKEEKDDDFYAMERWAGAFARSIALPQGLDPDRVEASFKNGVLEIRVPKTKEAKGKKIDIKIA